MTTLYKFKAYYTDAGVGTVQDPAPTCTVINMADDSKLADAQATTASTNMPGLYSYEYSGADGLDCVAFFATTDTGCDVKQLASYVSEKITTNLNADVAGVETKLDTVDSNVDAILADTGTDGVVLKAAGLNADAVTKIQSGLATPTNITAGTLTTVGTATNLTNLPTMPTDWVTAAGLKADAVAEIADGVWDEAIAGHTTTTTFGGKNQKVVPSETINDYKADVSALTNVKLAADQSGVTIPAVTTVTNLTNAPTAGDLTATMKSSITTAASSATPALSAAGVDAILDEVVVGSYTMRQLLTVMSAALAGKLSGGGTTTLTFRGIDDASDVIVATVDASNNRTALTINV